MPGSTDLVLRVIELLDQLVIPYMLVGSYSSNYYGKPRSTKDADFEIVVSNDQIAKLRELLPDFQMDTQMSFETISMTMRYILVHPESAFKIQLFMLGEDAYHQERFRRRQHLDFEGRLVWLPTAEDPTTGLVPPMPVPRHYS